MMRRSVIKQERGFYPGPVDNHLEGFSAICGITDSIDTDARLINRYGNSSDQRMYLRGQGGMG